MYVICIIIIINIVKYLKLITMKTQLRKLELIFKLTRFKPEMFYSISFSNSEINLQGKFTPSTNKLLKNINIDSNGYVKMEKYNLIITLTD